MNDEVVEFDDEETPAGIDYVRLRRVIALAIVDALTEIEERRARAAETKPAASVWAGLFEDGRG